MGVDKFGNVSADFDFQVDVVFNNVLSDDEVLSYQKIIHKTLNSGNCYVSTMYEYEDYYLFNPVLIFTFFDISRDEAISKAKHFKDIFTNEFILRFINDDEEFYV